MAILGTMTISSDIPSAQELESSLAAASARVDAIESTLNRHTTKLNELDGGCARRRNDNTFTGSNVFNTSIKLSSNASIFKNTVAGAAEQSANMNQYLAIYGSPAGEGGARVFLRHQDAWNQNGS